MIIGLTDVTASLCPQVQWNHESVLGQILVQLLENHARLGGHNAGVRVKSWNAEAKIDRSMLQIMPYSIEL